MFYFLSLKTFDNDFPSLSDTNSLINTSTITCTVSIGCDRPTGDCAGVGDRQSVKI